MFNLFNLIPLISDLHLSMSNDVVSTKIHDNRDDFYSEIVNFPFKDVMFLVLHLIVYMYISQLIQFDGAPSHVADINTRY